MAYPLRSLFRTGVTVAMFTLVVLTLVVGGTISGAFTNAFDDLHAFSGGFDVRATTSPGIPFNMKTALVADGGTIAPSVTAVSSSSVVPVAARQRGTRGYTNYLARGFDKTFFDRTTYGFAAMANGYRSPADVWRALRENPSYAVVDSLVAPRRQQYGFAGFSDFRLHGFYIEDRTFDPVGIDIRDPATGNPVRLEVIGVLADTAPQSLLGIWTSQITLAGVFGTQAIPTTHLFALRPGTDAVATASKLESRFLSAGMETEAMSEALDDAVSANKTFNGLMQGFMALGLVVGVVALGVISARSVVERRQQIGVLRAIGFRRGAVQLCFVLESTFIALTSIVVGTVMGLALAYTVIQDTQKQPSWSNIGFDVPWLNLGIIFLAVFVVTILTSLAPSIRASRVSPAEALRYQ
jgi:putative ABC transport system permease protein